MDRSSKTHTEFVDEEAACLDCGETFTRKRMVIDGRSAPYALRACEGCVEKENDQQPTSAPPYGPPRKDEILALLNDAGVNVRKHGRCSLLEGKERGVHFDASGCGPEPLEAAGTFVDETLSAGRWGGVLGLLLMGPLGSGKTHLAVAIVRAVLLDKRIDPNRVIFDRADRLITMIQDTYGTGGTAAILERRERAELLVLDDLGREKPTHDVLRILIDLIDARELHPTVITSNHTPGGLVSHFGDAPGWQRLASRLGPQNYRHVTVTGSDRRATA